jgi:hypothetical protein
MEIFLGFFASIVVHGFGFWYLHDIYVDLLQRLEGFDALLAANYRFDRSIGGDQFFLLKS